MNRKGDTNWVLVGILIAIMILLLFSWGYGSMIRRGGSDFFDFSCKYVKFPVVCKDRLYDHDGNLVNKPEIMKDQIFDPLNNALRDQDKYTDNGVTSDQLKKIIETSQCVQTLTHKDKTARLFKADISDNKPIYLIVGTKSPYTVSVLRPVLDTDDYNNYVYENLQQQLLETERYQGDYKDLALALYLERPGVGIIRGDARIDAQTESYCVEENWRWQCLRYEHFPLMKTFVNSKCPGG